MKFPWFKFSGLFFKPVSKAGWLILISGIAYLVYTFINIDSRSHSVSDTLRPFVIQLLIITVLYYLIAWLATRTPK